FKVDGANLGAVQTGAGPGYLISWNSTTAANGNHTLTAVATDAAGNSATATSISVTVNNPVQPPVISAVAATPTSSGAVISLTTNLPADTQVAYGTTTAYGSTSPRDTTLVTQHSVTL